MQLDAGCPAPADGRLYRPAAHEAMRAEAARAQTLVTYLDAEVIRARRERDQVLTDCANDMRAGAAQLALVSKELAAVPEPPSRAVWFIGGTLAGVALTASLVLVIR